MAINVSVNIFWREIVKQLCFNVCLFLTSTVTMIAKKQRCSSQRL